MKESKEIGKTIICLRNEISRAMEIISGEDGLSRAQGGILHYVFYVSKQKDVYQKDIEQEFNLRRASASELLQKLENISYIERVSDSKDKRLKKIIITDKGKMHVEMVRNNIQKMEEILHDGVSEEELSTFFHIITKMHTNCKKIQKEKKGEIV